MMAVSEGRGVEKYGSDDTMVSDVCVCVCVGGGGGGGATHFASYFAMMPALSETNVCPRAPSVGQCDAVARASVTS
jgi:hypothetical protein